MPGFEFDFRANGKGFKKDVGGMNKTVDGFVKSAGNMLKGLGVTFAAAFSVQAIKGAIGEMSNLYHEVEKLQVGAEDLQLFQYMFESMGGSSAQAGSAIEKFSKRIAEAAQGSGVLKKIVDQYNISLKDQNGNLRPTVEILRDYADIVANANDPAEQLRLTMEGFGKSNGQFVEVLREGSAGLENLRINFEKAGGAMTELQLQEMADLDQAFTDLTRSLEMDFSRVIVGVAEAWKGDSTTLLDVVSKWGIRFTQIFAGVIDGALTFVNSLKLGIQYAFKDMMLVGGAYLDQLVSQGYLKIQEFVQFLATSPFLKFSPIQAAAKQWKNLDIEIENTKQHIIESKQFVSEFGATANEQLLSILNGEGKISVAAEAVKDFYGLQNEELGTQAKKTDEVNKKSESLEKQVDKVSKSYKIVNGKIVEVQENTDETTKKTKTLKLGVDDVSGSYEVVEGKLVRVGEKTDQTTKKTKDLKQAVDDTSKSVSFLGDHFEGVGAKAAELAKKLDAAKTAYDAYVTKKTAELQALEAARKGDSSYSGKVKGIGEGDGSSSDTSTKTNNAQTDNSKDGGNFYDTVQGILPDDIYSLSDTQLMGYLQKIEYSLSDLYKSQQLNLYGNNHGSPDGYHNLWSSRRQAEVDQIVDALNISLGLTGTNKITGVSGTVGLVDQVMRKYQQAQDSNTAILRANSQEQTELLRELVTINGK